MYKITNIVASRTKGCMSHNHVTLQSPSFANHAIEPYVCGFQLKLFSEMNITDEQFVKFSNYLDELQKARIIEIKPIVDNTVIEKSKELVEDNITKEPKSISIEIQEDIEEVPQIEEIPTQVDIVLEAPVIEEEVEDTKIVVDSSKKKKIRR